MYRTRFVVLFHQMFFSIVFDWDEIFVPSGNPEYVHNYILAKSPLNCLHKFAGLIFNALIVFGLQQLLKLMICSMYTDIDSKAWSDNRFLLLPSN